MLRVTKRLLMPLLQLRRVSRLLRRLLLPRLPKQRRSRLVVTSNTEEVACFVV